MTLTTLINKMKLCKACKKKMPWDSPWYKFCNLEECTRARKLKMNLRYKKKHPYIPKVPHPQDDQATNWVCDCGYFITNTFKCCGDCESLKKHVADTKIDTGVFIPNKHGLDIKVFIDNYFKRHEIRTEHKI